MEIGKSPGEHNALIGKSECKTLTLQKQPENVLLEDSSH